MRCFPGKDFNTEPSEQDSLNRGRHRGLDFRVVCFSPGGPGTPFCLASVPLVGRSVLICISTHDYIHSCSGIRVILTPHPRGPDGPGPGPPCPNHSHPPQKEQDTHRQKKGGMAPNITEGTGSILRGKDNRCLPCLKTMPPESSPLRSPAYQREPRAQNSTVSAMDNFNRSTAHSSLTLHGKCCNLPATCN